jgi:hypothetical protein
VISLEDIIAEPIVSATQSLLDDVVGVREWKLKAPGKLPPDCGFT